MFSTYTKNTLPLHRIFCKVKFDFYFEFTTQSDTITILIEKHLKSEYKELKKKDVN